MTEEPVIEDATPAPPAPPFPEALAPTAPAPPPPPVLIVASLPLWVVPEA